MAALLTKTLGVVCPSCDFLNVVAAVRCMACGSATDGSSPAVAPPAPARVEPPKVVAVAPAPPPPETSEPTSPGSPMPAAPPGLAPKRGPSSPEPVSPPAGPPPAAPPRSGPPVRPTFSSLAEVPTPPPPAPPPQPQAPPGPKFGLSVVAGPARGQRFKLAAAGAQIGSSSGVILFTDDPFVSPLHATLTIRDGRLFVRDEASTSGVYVSINGTETIPAGGTFCTGLRLFRFLGSIEPPTPWNGRDVLVYGATVPNNQVHYAVEEVLVGDRGGRCLLSPGPVITVGQGRCDFTYANDEGLAPRHCEVAPLPTGAMIRDLSGGLGTYVRIAGERPLKAGDRVRVGQQTLQVEAV